MCKFYQGGEDKILEKKIKRLFEKVYREKPSASRSVSHLLCKAKAVSGWLNPLQESREGYFVALRRKVAPSREDVFAD